MSSTKQVERGHRKVRQGEVISDAMDKTVVVKVIRSYRHPLYKKVVKRARLYKAHDENNESRVGFVVEIVETRPLSKTKRWRISRIIKKVGVELAPDGEVAQ